ncbi:MAG: hypothetical protein AAFU61_12405 [Pseudomonadota bacterium]
MARSVVEPSEAERMVALARQGLSAVEIAEKVGRQSDTVRKIVKERCAEAAAAMKAAGRARIAEGGRMHAKARHAAVLRARLEAAPTLTIRTFAERFRLTLTKAKTWAAEHGVAFLSDADHLEAHAAELETLCRSMTAIRLGGHFKVEPRTVEYVLARRGLHAVPSRRGLTAEVEGLGEAVAVRWAAVAPSTGRPVPLVSYARSDCAVGLARLCALTGADPAALHPGRVCDLTGG